MIYMNIALLGYGIEGESAYNYFLDKYPDATFTIYDESDKPKKDIPKGIKFIGGQKNGFHNIDADIVVKTPAIPPEKVSSTGNITTATKEFFLACPAPIIGVTGTKGKGTTSSLIAEMLKASGKKVHLVGNIGVPALAELSKLSKEDIVVYELSSFQLWDLNKSPETAVVLMIEPDHLNVHKDLEDYVEAKSNITKYQEATDTVIYNPENSYSSEIAKISAGSKLPYNTKQAAYIEDDGIFIDETKVCSIEDVKIPGRHNLENICAAVSAVWLYTKDVESLQLAIRNFTGLPHRLKLVGQKKGVSYYDDSISTTIGSAIAALRSFKLPKVIILGGSKKGADFTELAKEIALSNIRKVIVYGEEAPQIIKALELENFLNFTYLEDTAMKDIVQYSASISELGDIVILSPACASFDMFDSYQDRGDQFVSAVQELDD